MRVCRSAGLENSKRDRTRHPSVCRVTVDCTDVTCKPWRSSSLLPIMDRYWVTAACSRVAVRDFCLSMALTRDTEHTAHTHTNSLMSGELVDQFPPQRSTVRRHNEPCVSTKSRTVNETTGPRSPHLLATAFSAFSNLEDRSPRWPLSDTYTVTHTKRLSSFKTHNTHSCTAHACKTWRRVWPRTPDRRMTSLKSMTRSHRRTQTPPH